MTSPDTLSPGRSSGRSAEILRGGLALVGDQVAAALTSMFAAALENLAGRTDADPGTAGARRLIEEKRIQLDRDFHGRLKQEQSEAVARLLKQDGGAASKTKITADSLSLVEDDEAATSDYIGKVARRMQGALELQLREINVVTAHLARRERVQISDDPFAPDVCMRALLEVARELGLETSSWLPLASAFERPMTEELRRAYQKLHDHFRKHKVDVAEVRRELAARQALGRPTLNPATKAPAPAAAGGDFNSGFAVTRSPGSQRLPWMEEVERFAQGQPTLSGVPTTAGGARTLGGGPVTVLTFGDVRTSLDQMMARMGAELRGLPVPAQAASQGAPPPDLLEAISEMQHVGVRAGMEAAAAALAPTVGAAGADQGAWRDVLLAKSNRTVDKLTIEIVGMLFDHVLQDEQVPAEIKAVLSRLQFPVLKVALVDADFFASGTHPARRLIDRLASTAVGWEPYGDENQRYKKELERVVLQVQERFDKDLGLFEQLLKEFDAFIAEMPTRETDPVARAKRALEEAEKREVLVINTTIQVRRAFEHVELEQYLREFLVGPWVQALVSATLRDEQTPGFSKAFRQSIHDMVWSVQPKISADERKRLVALIPGMTRVLRDGMAMIQMTEREQQDFLKNLMASHAVAVRPVDQATYIKRKVATGELRQRLDEMKITGVLPAGATAEGVKISTGALQQAAEHHAAQLVVAEPIAADEPLSSDEDAAFDGQIAEWERGSWFNLYDGKEVVKVKLRWISPLRTLFMFSNEADKSTRVLSPQTIKSYLKQGWLKPLESVPLTKRVAKRVIGEFERSAKRAEELAVRIGAKAEEKPA
ncbi:MAG: DUF1631 family protein [Burkholderiales bacterium]|nr:MAG: DUF1631 family protein [Burkholderiales bacterium]